LAGVFPERAADSYLAATFLARCAALADQDTTLPNAERPALPRTYSERARALLREVIHKGFQNLMLLKTNPNLDSLRSRQDFSELLTQLEKKDQGKG
jgi:hypothetical protein